MKGIHKQIYFGVFLLILITPSIGLILKLDFYHNCENRALAVQPKFEISDKYFKEFEVFFKERIGFRSTFSHLNSNLKFNLLNTSVKPMEVIPGENDFLIHASQKEQEIASYVGSNCWNNIELEEQYQMHFQRIKKLDSLNIDYLFIVCPNKNRIYPENLPWQMKFQTTKRGSRAEQLNTLFKNRKLSKSYIYLKDALLSKKGEGLLYLKQDTHWKNLGAFYGYQKIMGKFNIKPYNLSDFILREETKANGDLKRQIGICNNENYFESETVFALKKSSINNVVVKFNNDSAIHLVNKKAKDKRTIIVFQDSFGSALIQFVELHFENTIFIWSDYNENDIKKFNPDIVVVEKIERYL